VIGIGVQGLRFVGVGVLCCWRFNDVIEGFAAARKLPDVRGFLNGVREFRVFGSWLGVGWRGVEGLASEEIGSWVSVLV